MTSPYPARAVRYLRLIAKRIAYPRLVINAPSRHEEAIGFTVAIVFAALVVISGMSL